MYSYKVPYWTNVAYVGFNRLLLVLGALTILFISFLGHFKSTKHVLKNTYMRAFGRTAFDAGLMAPIVISWVFLSQEDAIYLTGPTSTIFGCANVILNLVTGILVFLFIEYPVSILMNILITNRLLSH